MNIVSKTVHLGGDAYVRKNADNSYSALAFGSFGPDQVGLRYEWIRIDKTKLSTKVIQALN